MNEIESINSSFYVRMQGDAMLDAGINDNDLLTITTGVGAVEGDIVLAMIDYDLVIRRFFMHKGKAVLMADNVNYPAIVIGEHEPFEICGVVQHLD